MLFVITTSGCKKDKEVYYTQGIFPDTTLIMTGINSAYDDIAEDFMVDENDLDGTADILLTTTRTSSGGKSDIAQAVINLSFGHKTGVFTIEGSTATDAYLAKLITKMNTDKNDLGPYRLFSSIDGFEYTLYSSVNSAGNLDFYYLRNQPAFGTTLPEVLGPYPTQVLNTAGDDDFICFDLNMDTCYFSSGPAGNQDIYVKSKATTVDFATWLSGAYTPASKPDSINSTSDDKGARIYKTFMIFSSNRPGGLGGYDLYYSVFRKGKWSFPVNMGPSINTSSDEIRPIIGRHSDYTNYFILFSSDREGGKGGFDIYFRGIELPK